MHTSQNEATVRAFLLGPGGLLRRYRPSVHLTGDLRKAEADDLARDLLEVLPDDLPEEELVVFLEATRRALRRTWGGPWWPTSTMIREAAEAAKQGRKGPEPEQAILGWLTDWWRRRGRCAPGLGTPERTARLIQMGVLTARQARAGAFPLTDRDEAAARQQSPCAAEIEIERRFRDRIGHRVAGGSDVAPR
jgi:hypothetical protein